MKGLTAEARERIESFYHSHSGYYEMLRGYETDEHFHHYMRYMAPYAESHPRALDLGCGTGFSTALLAGLGFEVFGTDLSKQLLDLSVPFRKKGGPRYLVGSGLQIPFADGAFDIVGIYDVIEHIPDVDRFLREAVRVIRPGGLIVIISPCMVTPLTPLRALFAPGGRQSIYSGRLEAVGAIFRNSWLAARKLVSPRVSFTYRQPRLQDEWSKEDDDTVYCTSPREIMRFLVREGMRAVRFQKDGSDRAHRLIARILPDIATEIFLVARKPEHEEK